MIYAGQKLNDNEWHAVRVVRRGKDFKLTVDEDVAEGTSVDEGRSMSTIYSCRAENIHEKMMLETWLKDWHSILSNV